MNKINKVGQEGNSIMHEIADFRLREKIARRPGRLITLTENEKARLRQWVEKTQVWRYSDFSTRILGMRIL